jgi:preprotein translocase subunit SecA
MVLDLIEDSVINMVERVTEGKRHAEEWDTRSLEEMVREVFDVSVDLGVLQEATLEELQDRVYGSVEKLIAEREKRFTPEAYYHVARIIYLQTIDALWKDHLREMDQLREGISLRGYAQKDPKQEYKKEGFNLFAAMHGAITGDVLTKLSRIVITQETEEDYQKRLEVQREKQRRLMKLGQPAAASPAAAAGGPAGKLAAPGKPETVRRETPKVGPNEPCPCGSGKKYKKCHMLTDQSAAG